MLKCTIVVSGELDNRFRGALDGLTSRVTDGTTELRGELIDQAEVQGVLHQLLDLGIEVLSFTTTPTGDPTNP